jgi:type II secretory pathway component GspD/PulD (secretin)
MQVTTKSIVAGMVCALLFVGSAVRAQNKDAAPKVITRVYDVASFLQRVTDYPYRGMASAKSIAMGEAAPQMGMEAEGMGAGMLHGTAPKSKGKSSEDQEEELVTLIKETVDPESWRDNGGSVGSARILHSMLIVTQTEENQQALGELLSQLRESTQRAVRVRASWITVTNTTDQFIDRKPAAQPLPGSAPVFPLVDLAGLVRAQADAIRYRGEIVCFNRQTVHIAAGRGRSVVTGVNPVVGTSVVGYDPTVEYVRSGAMLQVTPTISGDGGVVIDLQSSVNEIDEPQNDVLLDLTKVGATTQPIGPSGGITQIERLSALSQNFATTVRLPVGKPVLIGGMTMSSQGNDSQQLYLVWEVVAGE